MRIATLIVRTLLGLGFLVFGLNGFLHFMPQPPMPPSDAATFATILATHGWMTFVSFIEVVAALLVLAGFYVPVGLVILGPILVNILLFHLLLEGGKGIAGGVVFTLLELFLIYAYRRAFLGIFAAKTELA